jgi:hypothetical protein
VGNYRARYICSAAEQTSGFLRRHRILFSHEGGLFSFPLGCNFCARADTFRCGVTLYVRAGTSVKRRQCSLALIFFPSYLLQLSVNPGFSLAFDISLTLSGTPADGVALVLHNDARGVFAPTCPPSGTFRGSNVCANAVNNSVYVYAPKTYNGGATSNYLSTGAFLFGSAPSGGSAGNVVTSAPTVASGDVIQTFLNYSLASGALTWTMTRTVGAAATQSFSQTIGDLRSSVGSFAYFGFASATGGSFAGHSVSNVQIFPASSCNNREAVW